MNRQKGQYLPHAYIYYRHPHVYPPPILLLELPPLFVIEKDSIFYDVKAWEGDGLPMSCLDLQAIERKIVLCFAGVTYAACFPADLVRGISGSNRQPTD